jgi:glucokinase
MILVGDIGGTHTRLALALQDGQGWQLSHLQVLPTTADVSRVVCDYLAAHGSPALSAIACCGAGPLGQDGTIQLTNASVRLEPAGLARAAGVSAAIVVNDFAAIAQAIPHLPPAQCRKIGGGEIEPDAPRVVIGAGTGLGVASLLPVEGAWAVIPGEGGHADLAPVDDVQATVWQTLRVTHGRVSAEIVLSGPGLERLHAALGTGLAPSAAEIAQAAWQGEPVATQAVQLFTQWLGSFAGNLALTLGARGGIYLAGGIVPAWGEHFDGQLFREYVENKPPFQAWLTRVPSFVVTHPQPGLYGLAVLASSRVSKVG